MPTRSWRSKGTNPRCRKTSKPSTRRIFPPPHTTRDRGHGRIETRTVRASTALNGYLTFPHVQQVFQLERTVTDLSGNPLRHEVANYITSLSTQEAPPERLGSLARGQWTIESHHWIRDGVYDEDRSQVRRGSGPRAMATLRNLAISLLRVRNIAQALRVLDRHPDWLCAALGV